MTTYERLHEILLGEFDIAPERLSPATILEDIGIDSLGLMELLFRIEDEFHIKIPADQIELVRVEDVVAYIDRLVLDQNENVSNASSVL
jgi:acyl carrier protein